MNQLQTNARQTRPRIHLLYAASLLLLLGLIALSLYTASKPPPNQPLSRATPQAQPARANAKTHPFPRSTPVAPNAHATPVNAFCASILTPAELATPTAQKLNEFLQTRKLQPLREIKRPELEALVQSVTDRFPPQQIASWLEQSLKIPPSYLLQNGDLKSSLLGIYDAVVGSTESSSRPIERLTFTDQCEPSGRITGVTDTIPSGTKRIYAVFENNGNLANLQHVLAIWRYTSDDSISFTECELLRPHTTYNYVWLQPKSGGWHSGAYQLDLCDPANNSEVLVSQSFTVQ